MLISFGSALFTANLFATGFLYLAQIVEDFRDA
jgi:hypothetical protein